MCRTIPPRLDQSQWHCSPSRDPCGAPRAPPCALPPDKAPCTAASPCAPVATIATVPSRCPCSSFCSFSRVRQVSPFALFRSVSAPFTTGDVRGMLYECMLQLSETCQFCTDLCKNVMRPGARLRLNVLVCSDCLRVG